MASQLNAIANDGNLLRHVEIDDLADMLERLSNESVREECKLRAIATWLNVSNSATDQAIRDKYFDDLLATLNLHKLSPMFMFDLAMGTVDVKLPSACKTKLLELWRKEQSSVDYFAPTASTSSSSTAAKWAFFA